MQIKLSKMNQIHLTKIESMSLIELNDSLRRQTCLSKNRKFIEKLPDKGVSISLTITKLEAEIKHRNEMLLAEDALKKLSIKNPSEEAQQVNVRDPFVVKLCEVEKKLERERFKPHATQKNTAKTDLSSAKTIKFLKLTESLNLQNELRSKQVRIDLTEENDEKDAEAEFSDAGTSAD